MKWNVFFHIALLICHCFNLPCSLQTVQRGSECFPVVIWSSWALKFWNCLLLLGYCLSYSNTLKSWLGSINWDKLVENLNRIVSVAMISTIISAVLIAFLWEIHSCTFSNKCCTELRSFPELLTYFALVGKKKITLVDQIDLDKRILTLVSEFLLIHHMLHVCHLRRKSKVLWHFYQKEKKTLWMIQF